MPRTLQEILDHADEIADAFETHEADEVTDLSAELLQQLRKALKLRAAAERAIADTVAEMRKDGYSWTVIGGELGTTGEAARKRYKDHPASTATVDVAESVSMLAEALNAIPHAPLAAGTPFLSSAITDCVVASNWKLPDLFPRRILEIARTADNEDEAIEAIEHVIGKNPSHFLFNVRTPLPDGEMIIRVPHKTMRITASQAKSIKPAIGKSDPLKKPRSQGMSVTFKAGSISSTRNPR